MSDVTLSESETAILSEAAGRDGGLLVLPESMKTVTRQRLLGRLESAGLIVPAARDQDGAALTPAGYRAVGRRAPRRSEPRTNEPAPEVVRPIRTPTGTKQALVRELLGRGEGASLSELIATTGWLPHTTRAALSRLRSGGQALTKSAREDGNTAYRIVADEPAPTRAGRRRAVAQAEEASV